MKELKEIVNEQINTIIANGTVEQIIAEILQTTIKDIVIDAMSPYGDFGRSISQKIKESLNASLSGVSIPEYNKFIADIVEESYVDALNTDAKKHMIKLLEDKLSPVKTEITAQELIAEIQSYWEDDARQNGYEEIEIDWNRRNGAICITIKNPGFNWRSISVTFYNHRENDSNTYHVGYINEDQRVISGCITGATYALGLAGYFYKLYCANTKITGFDEVFGENIHLDWD